MPSLYGAYGEWFAHICAHTAENGAQGRMLCLQGVPGIKGDAGEPGKRGQDGNPVSSCPIGHTSENMALTCVVIYAGLESALLRSISSILGHGDRVGSEEVRVGCKGKVLLDQFFYRVYQESVVWLGLKGSR